MTNIWKFSDGLEVDEDEEEDEEVDEERERTILVVSGLLWLNWVLCLCDDGLVDDDDAFGGESTEGDEGNSGKIR